MKRKLNGPIKGNLSIITKRILIIFIIFTLFFIISSLVFSLSSPWPMFGHDPQHTGRSPYKGTDIDMLKWNFKTGDQVKSSPAIGSDGTIYFGSRDCNLYAINPNGILKWNFETGDQVESSPAIGSDGTIYFGSADKYFYAISPNGTMKWKLGIGDGAGSSPAIGSDGTIYVGGNINLYAINPNGTLKWRFKTGDQVESSPAIGSDGTIYVRSNDGYLYAINPDGAMRWKLGIGGSLYESPLFIKSGTGTIYDGTIYVELEEICPFGESGLICNYFYVINPNGTLKSKVKLERGLFKTIPAIDSDGTIYFGGKADSLYAISPDDSLKWKFGTGGEIESSPAIGSDGTIYFGSNDGNLYAIGSTDSSPQILDTSYPLKGSLHCPEARGYPCNGCSSVSGYINHFKGFNILTTNEDCYVNLTYNQGDYIGNQNNCEVIIKGEKWLGLELENESGTELVEEINSGRFDFQPANKFVERTMTIPGDNYQYEFANEGKEFRLYLSRNIKEAFKAVPWQNIVIEIKNKETNNVFKYKFEKGIFPLAYSWNSGGMANYGQCVWWAAKRWVEEVDSKTLFPFYPPSPQDVNVIKIDSNYQPQKYDILINYDPKNTIELGHYAFVEKVDGDQVYITQFNWIKPGEVYNYVLRTWKGNATNLFYSNDFYDEYYFKYYYRRMSIEITPIFTDSFEGRVNGNNKLTSSFYSQTIYSSNDISFVENGKIGKAVHLNSLSSYVGYQGKYINPDEGTIRFYFKPDLNFYKFYNLRQSAWKDYGTYKTPFGGFLVDTVAYLPAFTGSFSAFLGFSSDISNKNTNLSFGTWNGSSWSYTKYSNKDDLIFSSGTWYDFAFTWSKREGKIKIFIDEIEKASTNFNTSLSDKEPFFIGENPFEYSGTSYWPYGPHSLIGIYDELRVYDEALDFKE